MENSPTPALHEVQNVKWWEALDYIGVDAYYPLPTASENPSVDDLEAAWISGGYLTGFKKLSEEYGRQIL